MKLPVYQNPIPNLIARSAFVSTGNGHFARKAGSGLGTAAVTRVESTRMQLTIISLSKGDSLRTNDNHIARTNYRPHHPLLKSAIVKTMDPALLVMIAATTVVALNVQGPLPLLGITTPPNTLVVRERTVTVATVDVYQRVLAVLTATLVNEVTGKRRSDLACHHVGVRFSIDSRPNTGWVNEM